MDSTSQTPRKIMRSQGRGPVTLKSLLFICIVSNVFLLIQRQGGRKDKELHMAFPNHYAGWLQCIQDIQREIEESYKDVFRERKYSEADILYIDPAQHGNLGDAFIVEGTHRLMVRFGFSPHNIHACKESQANLLDTCTYDDWGKKEKFLAIWHGGGNWGDGWHVHNPRLSSMKKLLLESNATIVSFPQSIYYVTEGKENEDAAKLNGWINDTSTSSKLVLSFRQENQIELAQSLYPLADVRLVPDIAFMIGPLLNSKTIWTSRKESIEIPNVDILFLLRKDKESLMDCTSVEKALESLSATSPELGNRIKGLKYKITDWEGYGDVYRITHFKESDAMLKVEGARNLLGQGKVVVTDRLHSSILALLMHKPHVFIEQSYGKISNTRNTAFLASDHCTQDNLLFQQADDLEHAIDLALQFL